MTITINGSGTVTGANTLTNTNTVTSAAATALTLQSAGTTAVTVDTSQNVGIGTSSPAYKLDIVYNSAIARLQSTGASQNAQINFQTTVATWSVGSNIGLTNGSLEFYKGSNLMTLDASGNLLVGTTSTNPVGIRVNGSVIRQDGGFASRTISSNRDWSISVTSGSIINFYSDNGSATVFAGAINVNGNTTAYTSVSDYRLKENVQPMVGALARVQQLKPVTFAFKDGGQLSEGFVAHELQAVVPDCVTGTKDAVDSEGKPQYQSIDTSFLVATLTAAIQEQQALITSLTTRLTALENK